MMLHVGCLAFAELLKTILSYLTFNKLKAPPQRQFLLISYLHVYLHLLVPNQCYKGVSIRAMLALIIVIAAGFAGTWYLLDYLFIPEHLPNEPPLVGSEIPYIGHVLGLLQHGTKYLETTRCRILT